MLLIGSFALIGFPFLTGYYSKDLILEISFSKYTVTGSFCYVLGLLTAFFTSFYSYRVVYLTFIYKTNMLKFVVSKIHDAPFFIYLPLLILAFGSLVLGFFIKDMFVGLGSDF